MSMNVAGALRLGVLLAGLSALACGGCNKRPSRVTPDSIAGDAAKKAIELYDTNLDGFLDAAELEKAPGLKAGVAQIKGLSGPNQDPNVLAKEIQNAKISAEEIQVRIDAWKKSKDGRLPVSCSVTHNGQPLAGATVTAVPEEFLGGALKPATATTDEFGNARLSSAPSGSGDVPGMSPGYYRLQITKAGENIPSKYNSQTTLGMEVAADNQQTMRGGGPRFDLRY
jgi:hypothetical protein